MTDKELWRKRIAIMFEIDQLRDKCNCIKSDEMNNCEVCQNLKYYGKQLNKISKELKTRKGVWVKPKLKDHSFKSEVKLTVEMYKELYDSGLNYKQICDFIGYEQSWLYKFRKQNGLVDYGKEKCYVSRNIEKEKLLSLIEKGYTNEMLAKYFEVSVKSIIKFKKMNDLIGFNYKTRFKNRENRNIQ